jgi:hypothetical protein
VACHYHLTLTLLCPAAVVSCCFLLLLIPTSLIPPFLFTSLLQPTAGDIAPSTAQATSSYEVPHSPPPRDVTFGFFFFLSAYLVPLPLQSAAPERPIHLNIAILI